MPDGKKVTDIDKLLKRIQDLESSKSLKCGDFIYRGQGNSAWYLKSGAVRRIQGRKEALTGQYPDPEDVKDYILELVNDAKSLGLESHGQSGGDCSELKLLAELQHYGAATNLLDFSRNILVALWMACSEAPDADGKIFVVDLLQDQLGKEQIGLEELNADQVKTMTISDLFAKQNLLVWTPARFFSRIQSQSSTFLIARDESQIPREEIFIAQDAKKKLLQDLTERFFLNEAQLYPDLSGFARANRSELPCYIQSSNYYYAKARMFERLGKKENALSFLKKFRKTSSPDDAITYFRSGLMKSKLNDANGAIEDYNQAIQLNPNNADAYNNRGNLRSAMGDQDGARKDYDQAIQLNTKLAEAYNNRGILRRDLDDKKGALADYDQAIQLKPGYVNAYFNRGFLRSEMDDKTGALADYDQAIKLNPRFAEAYNNRGNLRKKMGDNKGAREDYDQAIQLNPEYANAYYNRGNLRSKMGDKTGAREDYEQAIRLNPKYAEVYEKSGVLRSEKGDKK